MNDLPAQGYMLASATRLYVVTGRDRPLVFDASTGKRLHQVQGGTGGTYALLVGDSLLYGPNKTGDVSLVNAESQDVLASFAGQHMIIAQPFSYLYGDQHLSALDRQTYVAKYAERTQFMRDQHAIKDKLKTAAADATGQLESEVQMLEERIQLINQDMAGCLKWRTACDCPISLVLAGTQLLAGGDGHVMAVNTADGREVWRRAVPGRVYGLAVSDGCFYASTDAGAIYCFGDRSALPDSAAELSLPTDDRSERIQEYVGPFATDQSPPAGIYGPFAEFITQGTVRIRWETEKPTTSELEFGIGLKHTRILRDAELKQQHEFTLTTVQPDIVYRYRIAGQTQSGDRLRTQPYLFDAHFEYLPVKTPDRPSPFAQDEAAIEAEAVAKQLLELCGVQRGYALILGADEGRLTYFLARHSDLKIVVVDPDRTRVRRIREAMDKAGLHGSRVAIHHGALDDLPFGPYLFNLITSERLLSGGEIPGTVAGVYRCLRPEGGTLVWGSLTGDDLATRIERWLGDEASGPRSWSGLAWDVGDFRYHQRGSLPGSGEWRHQYASADNAACSRDERVRGELAVQWWGRPGARPMPDRGNRNPPPVSARGRLYIQGNRTLFALDAYNGTILWTKQIPTMRRANMPRDGSNMVADQDHVWVAIGDRCVGFDGQTGQRILQHAVPQRASAQDSKWGYVSRVGPLLFGSSVRPGSQYLGDHGEWYEGFGDRDVARVNSDQLFAMYWDTGQVRWAYQRGLIMNSTITISDNRVYFIESRNPAAKQAESGRLLDEILHNQFLVALDRETGNIAWQQPFDFSLCESVTYCTHANGVLLISGTDRHANFHTYAFDSQTGDGLWQHEMPDKKGHHTGHLAHPTIVSDRVYFNKHTLALRTGEVLAVDDFNWHGCGVMSASNHVIFSRYEYHGMYDLESKQRTELLGLRSGCWLSLIPSGGLLLAPETSAGCSCGHALQTSIAYVPKGD